MHYKWTTMNTKFKVRFWCWPSKSNMFLKDHRSISAEVGNLSLGVQRGPIKISRARWRILNCLLCQKDKRKTPQDSYFIGQLLLPLFHFFAAFSLIVAIYRSVSLITKKWSFSVTLSSFVNFPYYIFEISFENSKLLRAFLLKLSEKC